MPRVTPSEVKGILLDDYGPRARGAGDPDLGPFISAANVVTTALRAAIIRYRKVTPTDAALQEIERWLSAHFYVMSDQNFSSKSQGGVSASFQGQTGMALDASKYGQTAKVIDTTRTLAAMSEGRIASAVWTGLPVSEQTPYESRN